MRMLYYSALQSAKDSSRRASGFLCAFRRWRTRSRRTEERSKQYMDARNIRIGETALPDLIQWLRHTGQPQTLESLTERYIEILRNLVHAEEGS